MLHVDVTIVSTSFAFLTDPLFTCFNQLIFRKQMKKIKSYLTPLLTSTSFYLNSCWTEEGKRNTCTVCQVCSWGSGLQQKDYKSAAAFSLTLLLMTQYAAMIKTLCLSDQPWRSWFSAWISINMSPRRSPFWSVPNVMHWSRMVQDNLWSKMANLSACPWLTKFEVHIVRYRMMFLLNKFISDLWPKWKILEIVNDKLIYTMNCHH